MGSHRSKLTVELTEMTPAEDEVVVEHKHQLLTYYLHGHYMHGLNVLTIYILADIDHKAQTVRFEPKSKGIHLSKKTVAFAELHKWQPKQYILVPSSARVPRRAGELCDHSAHLGQPWYPARIEVVRPVAMLITVNGIAFWTATDDPYIEPYHSYQTANFVAPPAT